MVMTPYQQTNWLHLAEQATKELDPKKLMRLVEELNRALAARDRTSDSLQVQEPI
jgi:hypothetical protein